MPKSSNNSSKFSLRVRFFPALDSRRTLVVSSLKSRSSTSSALAFFSVLLCSEVLAAFESLGYLGFSELLVARLSVLGFLTLLIAIDEASSPGRGDVSVRTCHDTSAHVGQLVEAHVCPA